MKHTNTSKINMVLNKFLFLTLLGLLTYLPSTLTGQNQQRVRVSFIVKSMPDIGTNKVYVTSDLLNMGPWQADKILLTKVQDGSWVGSIKLPTNIGIYLRFTQGDWKRNEQDKKGNPVTHFLVLEKDTLIQHRIKYWSVNGIAPVVKYPPSTTTKPTATKTKEPKKVIAPPKPPPPPKPKVVKPPFQFVRRHSSLGNGISLYKDVTIYLPPSYEKDSLRAYPCLYVHAGQQRYYGRSDFSGYNWHIPKLVKKMMKAGDIPEIIVIEIHNENDAQFRFLSRHMNKPYRSFMTDILKPFMDRKYRTQKDPASNCTIGSDYGAIWAFALTWEAPEDFGKAICFSPFFEKARQYYSYAYDVSQDNRDKNVFFYIDNSSTPTDKRRQDQLERMERVLNKKGVPTVFRTHTDYFWDTKRVEARIKAALMYVY